MANAPIQVILNADSYRKDREKPKPHPQNKKDFFAGRDEDFQRHRAKLLTQVQAARESLEQSGPEAMAYVKVTLQQSAWAKSHHPTDAILRENVAPPAGAGRLGELIKEVTPTALAKIDAAIHKAEISVANKFDKKTQEDVPAPTPYRCEAGAIDKIELWSKGDRRAFDLDRAVSWLQDARTGQAYIVELFARPPGPGKEDVVPAEKRRLFASLKEGLQKMGNGIVARIRPAAANDNTTLEIRLTTGEAPPALFVQSSVRRSGRNDFDPSAKRHSQLIGFLEKHPLVREIHLPAIVVQSAAAPAAAAPSGRKWTSPSKGRGNYPRIGIVDGGLGKHFKEWVVYHHDFLDASDAKLEHGSFIGGLLVSAKALNPQLAIDGDGCFVADLNLFADRNFAHYYPNGAEDFFDELDAAVETCTKQYGVRIFNLSVNAVRLIDLDQYSFAARRLDEIADKHGAIFVISAGNLRPGTSRKEWPADEAQAAAILAAHRDDQLFSPAESVRNVSVAAINPDGMTNSLAGALANYSRRGPGLRTGVKPDLCHVGGAGTKCPSAHHGLYSSDSAGSVISSCGTSYATPLVAKTLGWLDAQIEGTPSRETLIGLLVHKAQIPVILQAKAFQGIAQKLVGFGRPPAAADLLEGGDSEITLLFSSRIEEGKSLEFKFVWPALLVNPDGSCRGDVRLTLVSSPPLGYQYRDEFVRVNIEAALQQESKNGKFEKSELEPTYVFFSKSEKATERSLIEHKFKWSPVKHYSIHMPKGRGVSSNWRLVVHYLKRDGEVLPKEGIPFSVLLTIAGRREDAGVFEQMRQALQASGIKTADIRTAARVTPRV